MYSPLKQTSSVIGKACALLFAKQGGNGIIVANLDVNPTAGLEFLAVKC